MKRLPIVLSVAAFLLALLGVTSLGEAAKNALPFAKNADRVDTIHASKTPKAGQLYPLGKNGKFPAKVLSVTRGPKGDSGESGSTGPMGPQGPQGAAGLPNPNATSLNGYGASGLTRIARMIRSDGLVLTGSPQSYGTLSITAPAAGFVLISGSAKIYSLVHECSVNCVATGTLVHVEAFTGLLGQASVYGQEFGSMVWSWVFPVNAGENHFEIRLQRWTTGAAGEGTLYGDYATLAAIYSPFGPTGGSTLGAASAVVH